jgi:CPA2 family monovalent cation:H+ antiporter-2
VVAVSLSRVRAARLPELEVALAVVFALGLATLTERCGLGAALGAFCAGLAFGGNESRQTALAATTSLGALTGIFFFAATGAMFDPAWAWANAGMVLGALVVSVAVKAAIAAAALRLAGMPLRTAVGCGILLGNIGEFSFILAGAAFAGSTDPQVLALHRLIIAVTFLSFLLMPLIAWLAGRFLPRSSLETITDHGNTVVVAGLGPVGNTVVGLLRARGLPVMLVDRNENLLKPWRGAPGIACFRGPVEDIDQWLPLLGHRPSLVVLAFPVADTSAVVTRRLRQLDPGLVVIARAPYIAQIEVLRAAGAQEVICDEEATGNALEGPLQRALRVAASDPNRLRATRFVNE